jgi:sugar transferase (PEP-CTERM/EpsH1 system associated)
MLTSASITSSVFHDEGLAHWIKNIATRKSLRCVLAYSSAMAGYIDGDTGAARRIVDFVDVDAEKWRRRAERTGPPQAWLYAREAKALAGHDRRAADRADVCLFVSEAEAERFRSLAPRAAGKLHVLGNGVDTAYFSPRNDYPNPYGGFGPVIVFTGTMDYWPNVEAVEWFAGAVVPRLRRRVSGIRFAVVGRNPTRRVRALADRDGVTVAGAVADIRPYLAHADAVVAPLRVTLGIPNKILEGMAMAKPVVATPEAVSGLSLSEREGVVVESDPEALVATIAALLTVRERAVELGGRARRSAEDRVGWPAVVDRLTAIIDGMAGMK